MAEGLNKLSTCCHMYDVLSNLENTIKIYYKILVRYSQYSRGNFQLDIT